MQRHIIKYSIAGLFLFILSFVVVARVKAEPYGWSPDVDNSWKGPPTCTDAKPDKAPVLLQPNHPALPRASGDDEVRLQWHKVPGATGYNVYYGLSPLNYIFAAPDIEDSDNFTVGSLSNRTYYFAVQARKGCAAGDLSNEWPGRPRGGGYMLAASPGFVPVTQTGQYEADEGTYVPPSPTPTSGEGVEGITAEPRQDTYQAPPIDDVQVPPVIPTPTPKPKGFFTSILDFILGLFGR